MGSVKRPFGDPAEVSVLLPDIKPYLDMLIAFDAIFIRGSLVVQKKCFFYSLLMSDVSA